MIVKCLWNSIASKCIFETSTHNRYVNDFHVCIHITEQALLEENVISCICCCIVLSNTSLIDIWLCRCDIWQNKEQTSFLWGLLIIRTLHIQSLPRKVWQWDEQTLTNVCLFRCPFWQSRSLLSKQADPNVAKVAFQPNWPHKRGHSVGHCSFGVPKTETKMTKTTIFYLYLSYHQL